MCNREQVNLSKTLIDWYPFKVICISDLVAIMACSALLLNFLSEQDIKAGEREAVAVDGPIIS